MLLGNGDGTFQAARSFPAGEGPTALAVADFNGDGRLDVAVADGGDGNGNGARCVDPDWATAMARSRPRSFIQAGQTPSSIVAGDWTGNGVIDLAVANKDSNDVTVFLGDGHGGFRALPPISLGDQAGEPVAITAGDFTGNGHARPGCRRSEHRRRVDSPQATAKGILGAAPDPAWSRRV